MKPLRYVAFYACLAIGSFQARTSFADYVVMNPGEAKGQLVFLSEDDVTLRTQKYLNLNPLSIPVFAELPMDLTVVAGTITLKHQNLLSHVQIKSRARKTPNLDLSGVAGGWAHGPLKDFADGDWVHLHLADPKHTKHKDLVLVLGSSKEDALAAYRLRTPVRVELAADTTFNTILSSAQLGWRDFDKVGSKAANYAELARALNTHEKTWVREAFAVPFFYYADFVESNQNVKKSIRRILRDPLMKKVAKPTYRLKKLQSLQALINSDESTISESLIRDLLERLDRFKKQNGKPRKMKFRSSTNSEDLPHFNGAGLYTSKSYKPSKTPLKKIRNLKRALKTVWSSVWNQRAFDERAFFGISHEEVFMGIQVNPSFKDEEADGVIVTKNLFHQSHPELSGPGVTIEAQRGDTHSVANPTEGVRAEKILVLFDRYDPLDESRYKVHVLQKSNVADDKVTVLEKDNSNPVLTLSEVKTLVRLSLKAEDHFRPILGGDQPSFSLDLEFKVDQEDTKTRQIYLKQARPFID